MICILTEYCVGGKIKMRWVGHMAHMGEKRSVHRERGDWGDPDIDG
jgi:hypothetical protein